MPKEPKISTGFRLSPEALRLLDALGLLFDSKAEAVETAIRDLARKRKIKVQ